MTSYVELRVFFFFPVSNSFVESGAMVNLNLGMALIYRNSQLKIFLMDWYLERTLKSQFSHLVSLTGCLVLEAGTIS